MPAQCSIPGPRTIGTYLQACFHLYATSFLTVLYGTPWGHIWERHFNDGKDFFLLTFHVEALLSIPGQSESLSTITSGHWGFGGQEGTARAQGQLWPGSLPTPVLHPHLSPVPCPLPPERQVTCYTFLSSGRVFLGLIWKDALFPFFMGF